MSFTALGVLKGFAKGITIVECLYIDFIFSLRERADAFWNENDFGYLRNVGKLNLICEPNDNVS